MEGPPHSLLAVILSAAPLTNNLILVQIGDNGFTWPYQPISLTSQWQRFSITTTLQNGLTQLYLQFGNVPAGQTMEVWGAQLVVGTDPAPYSPTPGIGTITNYATTLPATLVTNGLNLNYLYDSFGNMLSNSGGFNDSYTTNNQMFGYPYDAAGNLLWDGYNVMTWDAESRLTSDAGATYIYDAEGNRVEKQGVGVTDTVYFGGRPLARYAAGQWTDLIYGPTGLLAEVPGTQNGAPVYRVTDHLGTTVGNLLANGTFVNSLDYTPFGQIFSGDTSDPYLFTGKERDSESGNDYFGARYYGSSMGRFMSPDPSGLLAMKLANPQSLNLYSYVRNNPLINIDPSGLDCVYATLDGKSVDSIDHESNSDQCGSSGGTWLTGYVNEDWAHYNQAAQAFEAASEDNGQVNFAQFQAGAQTDDNGNCLSGCGGYGYASASADSLLGQFVGNSLTTAPSQDPLSGLLAFITARDVPVSDFWKVLAGPIDPSKNNWAGPNGMGPPSGAGDWRAALHDYNWFKNGIDGGSMFNPTLSLATSKALIQSNWQLMQTGGFQGAKEKMIFGIVNAFQWYADSWK